MQKILIVDDVEINRELLRNILKEDYMIEMAVLENMGIRPVFSDYLFAEEGVRSATAKERADALMECYCDSGIDIIFDISGGDIANEILQMTWK